MATHPATCTICEAACGILVDEQGGRVRSVRGDPDDPMSRGYVCPKVVGMQDLHEDPDRLRRPLVREGRGFREATWEEALDLAAAGLRAVRARHGVDAIAIYQGNPTAHNLGLMTIGQAVLRTLGTKNLYSASSADQVPHMLAAHEVFGHVMLMPVPDLDRAEHLVILGANPLVSNGSIMTAPDVRRRLEAVRARGGRITVVDPRRTETAKLADEHVFLRPGADAGLLLAMIHVIFEEGLARPRHLERLLDGVDRLRAIARDFAPEQVEDATGVPARTIRRLARDFARAERAVLYARLGICHQVHGTLASWLVYALHAITGNLDRPGGLMWTTPAADVAWIADRFGLRGHGRFRSRVRGLAEVAGELPVATLADEIETPGEGQVRALITSAGNPVLSSPNGARLDRALATLEHVVCVDAYLNETTRHAHVILPPVSPLQRAHYDVALNAFAVRNGAKWVDPPLPRAPGELDDGQIFFELGLRLHVGDTALARAQPLLSSIGRKLGPETMIDLALRTGPYRLSIAKLRRRPHGVDLGALVPRLPGILRHAPKRVRVAPELFLREVPHLRGFLATIAAEDDELILIGRRHLRSNNSWLHNSARLVKGRRRCTLLVHPHDAEARGLVVGGLADIASSRGTITLPVEITDDVMPGVVSAPHGFGHDREGTRTHVASAHAGASVNDLTDERVLDRLSGNAAFSDLRVRVRAAAAESAAE